MEPNTKYLHISVALVVHFQQEKKNLKHIKHSNLNQWNHIVEKTMPGQSLSNWTSWWSKTYKSS